MFNEDAEYYTKIVPRDIDCNSGKAMFGVIVEHHQNEHKGNILVCNEDICVAAIDVTGHFKHGR